MTEIKKPLAQPEQNIAGAVMPNGVCVSNVYDAYEAGRASVLLAQPEQEPVAWMQDDIELYVQEEKDIVRGYVIPLYLAPPKRERLTDKEMMVMGMKVSIEMGYNDISPSDLEKSGCFKIIRAVEDHYGIGVKDE